MSADRSRSPEQVREAWEGVIVSTVNSLNGKFLSRAEYHNNMQKLNSSIREYNERFGNQTPVIIGQEVDLDIISDQVSFTISGIEPKDDRLVGPIGLIKDKRTGHLTYFDIEP